MAATGGAGMAPPPGAPTTVTRELSPQLIQEQLARARANEKELAPFNPPATQPVKQSAPVQAPAADFFGDAPAAAPPAQVVGPAAPVSPFQANPSDPESPARGRPTPPSDPGKAIIGGFGDPATFYVPLDGREVRDLVLLKMDDLIKAMENDLRFSLHLTYPRAKVTVTVTVEGHADPQHDIRLEKTIEAGKMPVEVARGLADEVVFVLVAGHVEDGESVTAPNAVRQQIGAEIPAKQRMQVGASAQIVDVLR